MKNKLLVTLLAHENVLFLPFRRRDWRSGRAPTRRQLQVEFRKKGGLRLPSTGTPAEKKATERRLQALDDEGLVVAGGDIRRTHTRLTDRGRATAAALCDQPTLLDGWLTVAELLKYAPPGVHISELLLSAPGLQEYGDDDSDQEIWLSEALALPALVAGWIEAASDLYGRTAYRVTPAGSAAAAGPEPVEPDDLPERDERLVAHYWQEYKAERSRLLVTKPADVNDIAPVPLSCGLWHEVVGPWSKNANA